jgi:hypothetical protein
MSFLALFPAFHFSAILLMCSWTKMIDELTTRVSRASRANAADAARSHFPARFAHFLIDTVAIRNHANWLKTDDRDHF